MKKTNLIILTLSFFALIPFSAISQLCYKTVNDCHYPSKKEGFLFNTQSQSGAFIQGDTAEVTIVVYKNMEYKIRACCPMSETMDGKLQFQITEALKKAEWKTYTVKEEVEEYDEYGESTGTKTVEKPVKKRVFVKYDQMRFDGFAEEGPSEFIFISDKTRKLTVKVFVPQVGGEGSDLEADDLACVGLLVEHRPAPKNVGKFGR